MVSGDFNRDGKADLAVTDLSGGSVSVLLGTGGIGYGATFAAAVSYATGSEPRSVAVGDFNSDGKADLAVANFLDNNVSILQGSGSGTFGTAVNYSVGPGPISVSVSDFNGDGKADLAVVNNGNSVATVLSGNGNGGFAAGVDYPVGSAAKFIAVGDLNRDGKTDLITANNSTSYISILKNVGGQFALVTASTAPSGGIPSGAMDDVLRITANHRGSAGDSPAELASLHLAFDNGAGAPGSAPLTSAQANAIIDEVSVYADTNNSGLFEVPGDTLLETEGTLALDAQGRQYVNLPDGSAACHISHGAPKSFFVTLKATANAASYSPNVARVTHVTQASSKGEDASNDSPLTLEFAPNTSTPMGGTPLPVTITGFAVE